MGNDSSITPTIKSKKSHEGKKNEIISFELISF